MSIEGFYFSEEKKIKLNGTTNIISSSGYKTPAYIEGEFFVLKYNPVGWVHIEDSRGIHFIPVHLLAGNVNKLLNEGKLIHCK